jgi:hypothetical protein
MVIHDLRNPIVSQEQSVSLLLEKLNRLGAYKGMQKKMNEASRKLTDSLHQEIFVARHRRQPV